MPAFLSAQQVFLSRQAWAWYMLRVQVVHVPARMTRWYFVALIHPPSNVQLVHQWSWIQGSSNIRSITNASFKCDCIISIIHETFIAFKTASCKIYSTCRHCLCTTVTRNIFISNKLCSILRPIFSNVHPCSREILSLFKPINATTM